MAAQGFKPGRFSPPTALRVVHYGVAVFPLGCSTDSGVPSSATPGLLCLAPCPIPGRGWLGRRLVLAIYTYLSRMQQQQANTSSKVRLTLPFKPLSSVGQSVGLIGKILKGKVQVNPRSSVQDRQWLRDPNLDPFLLPALRLSF